MRARRSRLVTTIGIVVAASALIAGCTSNSTSTESSDAAATAAAPAEESAAADAGTSANDAPGDLERSGFSAPAADHGWMAAITNAAQAEAANFS